MLARDRELKTLEEKCRALTQQLKAALDTHVMENLQMEKLQVECDALKHTIEDGDKKQHADDRTKRITESCDEYIRLSSGETVGSRVETHDKDGQRIRRESPMKASASVVATRTM